MLTEEQIQWLVPVFNMAYDILSKIPDIEPASKRGHRINATYFNSCYYEFFFDKDKGLFEVIYLEHGGEHHQIYGKTNKEIIQHILDQLIITDAHSFYANRKIEETCTKKPVDTDDYNTWRILFSTYSNERLEYCYGITDPLVDKIEESFCPPNLIDSGKESVKPVVNDDFVIIMPEYDKFFANIFFPHVRHYSNCRLILYDKNREEIQSFSIHKPHAEFDVTSFVKDTCVYSLVAGDVIIETHHY